MIARRTIYSLLLGIFSVLALQAWLLDHQTGCDRFLAGDHTQLPSVWVDSGDHRIEVPCGDWIDRQPIAVQITCLAEVAIFVVFLLSGIVDIVRWRNQRQAARGVNS
jgi:hypothetical protein